MTKKVDIEMSQEIQFGKNIDSYDNIKTFLVDKRVLISLVNNDKINFDDEYIRLNDLNQYRIIRQMYYNENSSRWAAKRLYTHITELEIGIDKFISYFNTITKQVHFYNPRVYKSSMKLIEKLYEYSGLKLFHKKKDTTSYLKSLEQLREWKTQFLSITDNDFIEFLHRFMDYPFTKTTLRRYYYEFTKK